MTSVRVLQIVCILSSLSLIGCGSKAVKLGGSDLEFLESSILEISSCLSTGRDCAIELVPSASTLTPALRDECFKRIERLTVQINGTVARTEVACLAAGMSINATAEADRSARAGVLTRPVAKLRIEAELGSGSNSAP